MELPILADGAEGLTERPSPSPCAWSGVAVARMASTAQPKPDPLAAPPDLTPERWKGARDPRASPFLKRLLRMTQRDLHKVRGCVGQSRFSCVSWKNRAEACA